MRLHGGPDSSSGLAFFLLCIAVLLLMLLSRTAHGQTVSQPEPPSLTSLLTSCEKRLILLVSRLEERTLQVQSLRESLTASGGQLLEAEQSLATLREELMATLKSREALLKNYSELETSWSGYRNEIRDQLLTIQRERNRAKTFAWVFGIGTAAGAVACIVMALR
jgi:hypothetical protein